MKLSRTVSYALQATLQLAEFGANQPVPCSRLASVGKMPERFLLQILRTLVAHGILDSTRGVEGGYRLERTAERISLLEIIEAVEGPIASPLPIGEGIPEESRVKLERALGEITTLARCKLEAVTLADLLPEPRGTIAGQVPISDGTFGDHDHQPVSGRILVRSQPPWKLGVQEALGKTY